jgi:hypothetical protein
MQQAALAVQSRVLGSGHPDTRITATNLAATLGEQLAIARRMHLALRGREGDGEVAMMAADVDDDRPGKIRSSTGDSNCGVDSGEGGGGDADGHGSAAVAATGLQAKISGASLVPGAADTTAVANANGQGSQGSNPRKKRKKNVEDAESP